jgi:DNA replication ATP-dependent helicase Dna2
VNFQYLCRNYLQKMPYQTEINITSEELFRRIEGILEAKETDVLAVNKMMHETLVLACHEGLKGTKQAFGNLFSQVDFLCKQHRVAVSDIVEIQKMRRDSNRSESLLPEEMLYDCRALAIFISTIYDTDVPDYLTGHIPVSRKALVEHRHIDYKYIRCLVKAFDDHTIEALVDQDAQEQTIKIDYSEEHFDYLQGLLKEGMQLNLLDSTLQDGLVKPQLIVLEPDYLIDISSIARCFQDYGHHPLSYLLNQLSPSANSQAILIGNFAGSALDDIINDKAAYDWQKTFKNNFKERALEYCTCPDLNQREDFKTAAISQANNIQQIVDFLFGAEGPSFDRNKAILEPSFVCEQLGIQGRVDLMTTDMQLLVEQKSGRNYNIENNFTNEYGSFQKEEHYVQLLLYYGVLRQNFLLGNNKVDIRLLYSRYPLPGGLVVVNFYQKLFREAIKFRNQLVWNEFNMAQNGFSTVIDHLQPDIFLQNPRKKDFFDRWKRPQISQITDSLHALSPIEKAYVCRMMTFVYRENLSSRLGAQEGQGNNSADLWNLPLAEKKETGSIYTNLNIINKEKSSDYNGFDLITLSVPDQGEDFLPNFRTGDFIYLYAYKKGEEPDVRRSILFKGSIVEMRSDLLLIHLSDGQQNPDVISGEVFALEHSDIGGSAAIRGLAQFASTLPERRDLLLGKRAPKADHSITLSRSYSPDYDDLLLKAKQAQDYFLLVGPPGTGKTSMALQFMVREALTEKDASILLMSYTNRAVDEICGMLEDNHLGYMRIGQEFSCDERYRSHLIKYAIEECPLLSEIKAKIKATRIFVATTTSMQSNANLFNLKHFSLAIIDESSQILEPNIIGLLASHDSQLHIRKFILIGDYKQLPAVVQQDAIESAVEDPLLNNICLDNCRNSLFERLIRWETKQGRNDFIGILRKQGRMHPDIAEFPNRMFYFREKLEPVPLEHQMETELHYDLPSQDAFDDLLKAKRVIFIPSKFCKQPNLSDKVNTEEATIVSETLRRIYRFYGRLFDAQKTVGVIVPYRNQIAMIRKNIEQMGIPELEKVSIDTVERYQGSQRDVIIYSFTIQNQYQLDFLTSNSFEEDGHIIDRKLNVAMTRARKQLILTGNPKILSLNGIFDQLIIQIKERKGYFYE